ncbi:unnamed protein product [Commensalibacter communis]|uniref:methylamine utilization protein MauJ n=1 Tax=Commensalibacter communis TaxID=2972786 RepID=UPI0022FF64F3|nr:methylamine utilization protein MauJ [Commensalibacter communis]CAI3924455.1 unnamed protein product [Commensalibacter communis]CAI3934699.1 unnamed protein product [Commensalibacter communis]
MEECKLYNNEELIEFFQKSLIEYAKVNLQEDFKEENINKKINIESWFFNKHKKQLEKFNKIVETTNKKLHSLSIFQDVIIHSSHYFEIPIYFSCDDYLELNYSTRTASICDENNHINYELNSNPSPEFTLLMFNHLKRLYQKPIIDDNNFTAFDVLYNSIKDDYIFTSYPFHYSFNLKITTQQPIDFQTFKKLSDAFLFQVMLNCNIPCEYCLNILALLDINTGGYFKKKNLNILTTPPQRIYHNHIIDYYSLALSSNEPFAQYLSYYHVLEYFFDEVFNENLRKEFQNKITHPNFSYKNNNELDKVIDFIKKETRDYKKNGQGNELESLKLVLKKFINRGELQKRLSPEQIEYYLKNKISFSHAPTISFKDTEGFYNHLAQRIYQTRNALVHSKEGNVGRYKPYQDSEELSKEIPLIKLVAEQVIINSSTPL